MLKKLLLDNKMCYNSNIDIIEADLKIIINKINVNGECYMKLFADYKIEDGYKRISIWDIYNSYESYIKENEYIELNEYYYRYYKGKLYSTHKSNKKSMYLVNNKSNGKIYFKYSGKHNGKFNQESVSHSTYKDIIKEMDILNLVVNEEA